MEKRARREADTALITACESGDKQRVLSLLDRGADPNSQNRDGLSPLIMACENGNKEIVLLLLDQEPIQILRINMDILLSLLPALKVTKK